MLRRFAWIVAFSVVSSSLSGCVLDRAGQGPRLDGGRTDGSPELPDANDPTCREGTCDDANPCTDDRCDPESGCQHDPNTASCDDGVLCNGADTCQARTCSVHDGVDPCPGDTVCDPERDLCVGCRADDECPADMPGDWSACDFPSDVCAEEGTRSRSVSEYACVDGECRASDRTETETCARDTTGVSCGADEVGDYSACMFPSDVCVESGMRSRTITRHTCASGACGSTDLTEFDTTSCPRETDGTSCGAEIIGDWGTCNPTAGVCSTAGRRQRTRTVPICASGACAGMDTIESESCTRPPTDGMSCGTNTCTAWSPCVPTSPNPCERNGTRSRQCRQRFCMTGACTPTAPFPEVEMCPIDPGPGC
jgi:hypothetical protein